MKFMRVLFLALMFSGCVTNADPADDTTGYNHKLGTGDSAHAFLASTTFTKLVVEIQAVKGYAPSAAACDKLKAFLEARLNKPEGVEIIVDDTLPAQGKTHYSIADVRAIEDANRKHFSKDNVLAAYFLFLDGGSTDDKDEFKILGHAYRNTSMVLYEKTIRDLSGGIGEPPTPTVEATVLNHEFGHILGLVDTGIPPVDAGHHDHPHGAHCTNPDCLMYYAVDSSEFLPNLLGSAGLGDGNIPALDENCINDLRSFGGK